MLFELLRFGLSSHNQICISFYWLHVSCFCYYSRHVKVRLMFSLWNYTIPWTLQFMSSLAQLDHVEVRLFKVPGNLSFLVPFLYCFTTTHWSFKRYVCQIYQIKNKFPILEWIIQSIWSLKNKSTLELQTGFFLSFSLWLSFIPFSLLLLFHSVMLTKHWEMMMFIRSADYFEWTAGLSVVWINENIVHSMKEIFYRDWDSQYIIKVNRTLPPLETLMKFVPST
jgi:hypothetical protein